MSVTSPPLRTPQRKEVMTELHLSNRHRIVQSFPIVGYKSGSSEGQAYGSQG